MDDRQRALLPPTRRLPPFIRQQALPNPAVTTASPIFFSGTRRYRFKKLMGNPLTQIVVVVVAARPKRHVELPSDSSSLFDVNDTEDKLGKKKKKQQLLPLIRSRFFGFLKKDKDA